MPPSSETSKARPSRECAAAAKASSLRLAHTSTTYPPRSTLRVLVIAQVESRDPHRRAGAPPHHARLAFHAIVHRIARAHQVQVAREVEGEIVIRKAVPARRIPVAARADEVNVVARLVDHFARMAELELVFAPRVQRLRRRHQEQIVASAHQVQPRAFGLQHLRRHAIHPHLRHRHLPRNIERRRGQRSPPSLSP